MPGKYMRGALVQFMETLLIPLPNVIVFQYNPETITHSWSQGEASAQMTAADGRPNPLAVRGLPGESFRLMIAMDAGDMIADGGPIGQTLAAASGVYSRLAALEMLLFPAAPSGGDSLVGTVSVSAGGAGGAIGGALGGGGGAPSRPVPVSTLPTVLFVWGPGRILPVRVTSLSITEKLYDPLLNPTHAEATLDLKVLTPEELSAQHDLLAPIARAGYKYTQILREALAVANLGNSVESIIGMLPIGG